MSLVLERCLFCRVLQLTRDTYFSQRRVDHHWRYLSFTLLLSNYLIAVHVNFQAFNCIQIIITSFFWLFHVLAELNSNKRYLILFFLSNYTFTFAGIVTINLILLTFWDILFILKFSGCFLFYTSGVAWLVIILLQTMTGGRPGILLFVNSFNFTVSECNLILFCLLFLLRQFPNSRPWWSHMADYCAVMALCAPFMRETCCLPTG